MSRLFGVSRHLEIESLETKSRISKTKNSNILVSSEVADLVRQGNDSRKLCKVVMGERKQL